MMTIALVLGTLALTISIGSVGLAAFGTWLTLRKLKEARPRPDHPYNLYPVTVLRPLCGLDAGIDENLKSVFELDYPDVEIFFSVAHRLDPVLARVEHWMKRYPRVRARVFVGESSVGENPKVNNLARAYEAARRDWVVISDSNVRLKPDYLKTLMACAIQAGSSVGVVTSVITGVEESGVGGSLERLTLAGFTARFMNLTEWWGHPCVVGKSMLFRKSVAQRFGGLEILGRYIAEDYMAGVAFQQIGYRSVLCTDPVEQVLGRYSLSTYMSRHVRWGRIRKAQKFTVFLLEPLSGVFASLALGLLGLTLLGAIQDPGDFWGVIGVFTGFWAFLDLLQWRALSRPEDRQIPLFFWVTFLVREALALVAWAVALSGSQVNWRGVRYQLKPGGLLTKA